MELNFLILGFFPPKYIIIVHMVFITFIIEDIHSLNVKKVNKSLFDLVILESVMQWDTHDQYYRGEREANFNL